jgi:uncharacterized protein with beta-barrel porin domain
VVAQSGAGGGGPAVGTGQAINAIIQASGGGAGGGNATAQAFASVIVPVLTNLPAPQQTKALTQLAPSPVASQVVVSTASSASTQVTGAVGGQQSAYQSLVQGRRYASLADDYYGGDSGMASRGLWGKILGGGSQGDVSGGAPFSVSVFGAVVGADLVKTDRVYGGVAVSWVGAWATGKGDLAGSSTHMNSYQVTATGTAGPAPLGGRLSVDGQIAIGINRYDQTRRIDFLNSTARASYQGEQYVGSLKVGYAFAGRTLTFTPYAGGRASPTSPSTP